MGIAFHKCQMTMDKHKIGIVTFPIDKASVTPLYNLSNIISCLTDRVYIITGNAGVDVTQKLKEPHFELISYTSGSNTITRICNYAKTQLAITLRMANL